MGRLNYTNVSLAGGTQVVGRRADPRLQRKIDGVKLGQVVAKDLTKRIPPALGSKAALRDPVVEIDLRSKQLTDAGFIELSEGLIKSLHQNVLQSNIVLLEELCLKANQLTVASLESLTPIIKLVANDLRDLDLSDNLISVNDPDDVIPWEAFLTSLSQCCVLRRLDLSGNELGTKAFEVLARVYAREEPIDADLFEELGRLGNTSVTNCAASLEQVNLDSSRISTPESDDIVSTEEKRRKHKPRKDRMQRNGSITLEKSHHSSPGKHDYSPDRLEHLRMYSETKGLHSIPYIVLTDTCMRDAGALYLSYIIVEQRDPSQLLSRVPPAKPGPEQHQLDFYDETQCRGIIYTTNAKATKMGIKVLDLAERERRTVAEHLSPIESNDALNSLVKADPMSEHSHGLSALAHQLKVKRHRRRTSSSTNGNIGISATAQKSMSDLDRARSRIQGEELERTGQYGNDLWRAAVNMLCLCREIQYPRPKECHPATHHFIQNTVPNLYRSSADVLLGDDFPVLPPSTPQKPRKPIVKTLEVPGYPTRNCKASAPLLPLSNGNPNQAMVPRSNYARNLSVCETTNGLTLQSGTLQPTPPDTKMANAVARLKATEYRSRLPCGFSEEVWWKILGQASSANGILSQRQQKSVLAWAMDRNTLKREREWLVEKEGNQIWHVLDGMSCVACEFDG